MERRWKANILFCGFYLLILGRSESKPSPSSDYTSMFATNYAKVSRTGILPAENSSSENVTKEAEHQVTTNSSCCGSAGLQQIVYPANSSVFLTVYPENHRNEGLPMKTSSEDVSNGGRSYKDVFAVSPKGSGDFHAALSPKKLSYDSFFQPEAVNIPQFAQDRYAATRTRAKKPESSRGKPSRRPTMPVQLPYQPDFSDSLNTYLPPPPQKSYDDGPPVSSYDARDSKPPEMGPVLPYAPDYSPSADAPSDSGYDYPPPDTTAPKKPEKSPPFMQSGPAPSKSNMPDSEMPGLPPGSMPELEPPQGYSYTPPPEESQMSPDNNPPAFPPFESPNKPVIESGPPKGYSYSPPPEESQMRPSNFPSYKPPNKPPNHEEDPYEDHPFGYPKSKPDHEEHHPYQGNTYKPPKPKQKSKPKPKPKPNPEMFFHSGHGDIPPEKLMPPSPETPPHPGYKSHHPSHKEWLFQPETNEYYYHPDEEKMKKPKKPPKANEENVPKPPFHEDEKYFLEPPEHKAPHEHEHENEPEYIHTAHHQHHHKEKKPEMMEDHESEDRLNKKPYSYYYIGRKLWFVPLYFSVYFIIYVTALILKSIARHKINYPHHSEPADWSGRRSRALLNETTDQVAQGLQNAASKYMHM